MPESLLNKYPHLKLLIAEKRDSSAQGNQTANKTEKSSPIASDAPAGGHIVQALATRADSPEYISVPRDGGPRYSSVLEADSPCTLSYQGCQP